MTLFQLYPNPFNPTTTIRFSLLKPGHVTLKVLDLPGRELAILTDRELDAGEHSVNYAANDLPSGVYFVQIKTDALTAIRKAVLVK
ncbi:T9SS type A sorting domain-containing protein [candidate division KSB1 bacterium]|nr:T9SS type A sorting domain-containing protein [candidate division KSB1 bacterium]